MLDEVLYEIGNLKWMMLFHLFITILVCGYFTLTTHTFNWKRSNFIKFAYLYNLTKNQAIAVALILGRFLFVITSVIFCERVFIGYYFVFVMFAVAIGFFSKDIKVLTSGLIYYFVIYVLLYIQSQLFVFYRTFESEMIILIMLISVGLFNVLASLYLSIGTYESITKKRLMNV